MMHEGLEAALDELGLGAPREPQHAPSHRLQGRISAAVALERGAGAVGVPAVELDDQAVRRPAEVDLEARVVGR
jgi:hypothetical protein